MATRSTNTGTKVFLASAVAGLIALNTSARRRWLRTRPMTAR